MSHNSQYCIICKKRPTWNTKFFSSNLCRECLEAQVDCLREINKAFLANLSQKKLKEAILSARFKANEVFGTPQNELIEKTYQDYPSVFTDDKKILLK